MDINSPGLNYGIGLFETLRVTGGRPEYLQAHLKRLMDAIEILGLKPLEEALLVKAMDRHLETEGLDAGRLKVLYNDLGLFITSGDNPYKKEDYDRGMALEISRVRVPSRSRYTLKTTNYLVPHLELKAARAAGYDEVVFTNDLGELVEGSRSNLFLIREGRVHTPGLASGCLEGILRQEVLTTLKETCLEVSLPVADLDRFEAGFLTNSLMGVMPIASIQGRSMDKDHPLIQDLVKKYSKEG